MYPLCLYFPLRAIEISLVFASPVIQTKLLMYLNRDGEIAVINEYSKYKSRMLLLGLSEGSFVHFSSFVQDVSSITQRRVAQMKNTLLSRCLPYQLPTHIL